MAKKKNGIRVSFVGANSEEVTGSCTHIKSNDLEILLECGLYQSCTTPLNDYKVNSHKLGFKPKNIDYIFAMHNHIDHIGKIPMLYKNGCTAKIIAPKGSYIIAKELLSDCAHINQRDAEYISKKTGKAVPPLFSIDDVSTCMEHWCEYEIKEKITLDEDVEFNFLPSGHILNSTQLELWIRNGNSVKKIGYTSDLGNTKFKKYYTNEFEPIKNCNLLIGESTYSRGDREVSLKDRDKDLEKLESIIKEVCINKKGKVLIPVFANDRCQNMISYIYDIFSQDEDFDIPIIVDSPMATKITHIYEQLLFDKEQNRKYREILNWKNLSFAKEYKDSKNLMTSGKPMVILSCSGMLTNGRAVTWCKELLGKQKNHIVFCGYSPENSLGGKIKKGKQKYVTVDGASVSNKCGVTDLRSFTSHMQYSDMVKYYSDVNCEKVALVHGNFDDKCEFAKEIQKEISKKNKTHKVICVNKSTEITL